MVENPEVAEEEESKAMPITSIKTRDKLASSGKRQRLASTVAKLNLSDTLATEAVTSIFMPEEIKTIMAEVEEQEDFSQSASDCSAPLSQLRAKDRSMKKEGVMVPSSKSRARTEPSQNRKRD